MTRAKHGGLTVYIRHESGAMHAFAGRRLSKLLGELERGEGGETLTALFESGYRETMGGLPVDGWTYEALLAEAQGRFGTD